MFERLASARPDPPRPPHGDPAEAARHPRSKTIALLGVAGVGGSGLALQARLNGELGVELGSPIAAATVNFGVGFFVVVTALIMRRVPLRPPVPRGSTRWWHWTGGLCAVVFVYAVIVGTPELGVALVAVATAAGMACAGLFADRVGLGLGGKRALEWSRIAGATLAVVAVVVSGAEGLRGVGGWQYLAFAGAGGFAMGCQQPINSRLAGALGEVRLAAVVSFAVGSVVVIVLASTHWPNSPWPADPILYLGGALAAAYVLAAIPIVAQVGALRLVLATMTGELFGAAVLDVVAPIGGHGLTLTRLVGVLTAASAVVLASVHPPTRFRRRSRW